MGRLLYGSRQQQMTFDDRLLWHLKLVITSKLRRQENFTFSSIDPEGGLTCLWLHPQCDVVFQFDSADQPEVNKDWLEALMHSANTTGGMHVMPEPA